MEYVGRTPSPPLDAFVERIWYCSDATLGARERVIPGGGTIDLVVNLAEDAIRTYEPEDAQSRGASACSGAFGSEIRRGTYARRPRFFNR